MHEKHRRNGWHSHDEFVSFIKTGKVGNLCIQSVKKTVAYKYKKRYELLYKHTLLQHELNFYI